MNDSPVEMKGAVRSRPRWVRWSVAGLLLLGVLSAGGVAGYVTWRAREIPNVTFPPRTICPLPSVAEIQRGTEEDRELAARFAREMSELEKRSDKIAPPGSLYPYSNTAPWHYQDLLRAFANVPEEKAWLEANREWVLGEKTTQSGDESRASSSAALNEILKHKDQALRDLQWLHLVAARQLMAEKKLDEALEQVLDGIRIERLFERKDLPLSLRELRLLKIAPQGMVGLNNCLQVLKVWSLCEGQTSERVVQAIPRLQEEFKKFLRMPEKLVLQWGMSRKELERELGEKKLSAWEQERARRVLNLAYCGEFVRITRDLANFQDLDDGPQIPFPEGHQGDEIERQIKVLQSEGMAKDSAVQLVRRIMYPSWDAHLAGRQNEQSALLIMGICAYRLDHGKLPDQLSQLLGKYFEVLPREPYSLGDFGYLTSGVLLGPGKAYGGDGTKAPLLYRTDVTRARGLWTNQKGESYVVYEPFLNREGVQATRPQAFIIPPTVDAFQQEQERQQKGREAVEKQRLKLSKGAAAGVPAGIRPGPPAPPGVAAPGG